MRAGGGCAGGCTPRTFGARAAAGGGSGVATGVGSLPVEEAHERLAGGGVSVEVGRLALGQPVGQAGVGSHQEPAGERRQVRREGDR